MSPPEAQTLDALVVHSQVNYLVPTGEKPVNETYGPDGLMRRRDASINDYRFWK